MYFWPSYRFISSIFSNKLDYLMAQKVVIFMHHLKGQNMSRARLFFSHSNNCGCEHGKVPIFPELKSACVHSKGILLFPSVSEPSTFCLQLSAGVRYSDLFMTTQTGGGRKKGMFGRGQGDIPRRALVLAFVRWPKGDARYQGAPQKALR